MLFRMILSSILWMMILTQEYEKFSISNGETIDSGFTRFNASVTSLKSLDPDYPSNNHVRNSNSHYSANYAKFPYLKKEKYEIRGYEDGVLIQNADQLFEDCSGKGTAQRGLGKRCTKKYNLFTSVSLDEHVAYKGRIKILLTEEEAYTRFYEQFQKILSQLNQLWCKVAVQPPLIPAFHWNLLPALAQSQLIQISRVIVFHQISQTSWFWREGRTKDELQQSATTRFDSKGKLGAENKTSEVEKGFLLSIVRKLLKHIESQKDWYHKTQMALEEKIRVLTANLENTTNTLSYTETLHDQAQKEKKEWEVKYEATLARFEKWKESSKNLNKLINSSMSTRTKVGLGFKEYFGENEVFDLSRPSTMYPEPVEQEVNPLYSRFVKAGEMHAVPPSITGTYMPSPYQSDIEETQVSYGSKSDNKTSDTISESNDFVSCDNSDKSSDSATYASCDSSLKTKTKDFPPAVGITTLPESDVEDPNSTTGSPSFSCSENVKSPRINCNKSGMNNRNMCKNNYVRVKKCFVCGSKLHLIKDCDFYNCVDSVPCKSQAASVPAGSSNSSASVTADGSDPAASRNRPAVISAGRPKPTERVKQPAGWSKRPAPVSAGGPVSAGWLNPAARPFFRPSSVHFNNMYWPNVYDPMYMTKGRWGTAGDPSTDNDIGIVDSGCSRSMTGNKEKLDDFVQIKGGIVKFGGGDGRISGKGTIRTSKLDFENVYYVEELQHFNLFSVSQICDKKNKVLFTDTDCLVLSEEFQLPDESQVVLRIPREHDLYTFHISDLQPEQKVTCLVAKASLDESTRWHRRMAHVNFKTINKLAKGGLVDGLPLKVFTNEHNCVACNKGKQHKASYKHISAVRLITETLQLLHMDLFGPTNIRSIDQKYYSLVVTDDFSRFTWTFYLGTKDETFYVLKEFIALIENQLNKKVKGIRCDNGTEFKNAKLIELCVEKGIKRDYSNPRTPQQNGVTAGIKSDRIC
ncbi:putative ribonuclease H-like domain-containing protein [Tanacetum coccineum]